MQIRISIIVLSLLTFYSCTQERPLPKIENASFLHNSMQTLSDIIVQDVFSPPVASRVYTYPSIGAYEILASQNNDYPSFAGKLNGLDSIPDYLNATEISYEVAALHAFNQIAKALIFSEIIMDEFQKLQKDSLMRIGFTENKINESQKYGQVVADFILKWANNDNYKETRTFPKHSFSDEPGKWQPTPPNYMQGIEPHWREIRPFVLDSSTQFIPEPPTPFNAEKGSKFYEETMEVYEAIKKDSLNRTAIASFWDCNPYVARQTGHVMYATKKITPGGHWVGIARIAAEKSNADLMQTAFTYASTTIALSDAFISCWDEKYRSNLIRPETVINQHIDDSWKPILQTPPFPEHTSGHSVISASAATVLTQLYGDSFDYTDDVEVKYGLPSRDFKSFYEASEEAAVSRLYGGIHYRPAIDEGVKQGKLVGEFIVKKLSLKRI